VSAHFMWEWLLSRLDSVIRRLKAQRSCLNAAAAMISARQGIVLELGLGNGRTFDHLRSRLPDHEIFVFDRQVAAHPDSTPDADHLILGDLKLTLHELQLRFRNSVVLVHSDVGTGDAASNAILAEFVGAALVPMLAPNAVVVSDQAIKILGAAAIELPRDVQLGRYFMVQMRSEDHEGQG
jgi:hypothetical protein